MLKNSIGWILGILICFSSLIEQTYATCSISAVANSDLTSDTTINDGDNQVITCTQYTHLASTDRTATFTITCSSGSSSGVQTCTSAADCSEPSQTGYTFNPGSTFETQTRSGSCATGYSGSASTITCEASGSWTSSTGCTIVSCGTPSGSTGYVISSGNSNYGDTRTVNCADGYGDSPTDLTCQSSGDWTGLTGCSGNLNVT